MICGRTGQRMNPWGIQRRSGEIRSSSAELGCHFDDVSAQGCERFLNSRRSKAADERLSSAGASDIRRLDGELLKRQQIEIVAAPGPLKGRTNRKRRIDNAG
ncbi:unnamed protein product [Angiostrongylus costaricensis]|uniref:Uncharacterized protein n=1 Tax=Angiostrongylus costaricensis TaxID=334426 RepID=A0A0R3PPV5_ANGCS|nr:unnamed protein product [Angiostrongylus costaricensis]